MWAPYPDLRSHCVTAPSSRRPRGRTVPRVPAWSAAPTLTEALRLELGVGAQYEHTKVAELVRENFQQIQ